MPIVTPVMWSRKEGETLTVYNARKAFEISKHKLDQCTKGKVNLSPEEYEDLCQLLCKNEYLYQEVIYASRNNHNNHDTWNKVLVFKDPTSINISRHHLLSL